MSRRSDDIQALLGRSQKDLEKIEAEYAISLKKKVVSADLRIDIKNLCENLRSVLDYLAQEIRDVHCSAAKSGRFYFPILPTRKEFEARMEQWFPGLRSSKPDLWDYMESLQPYQDKQEWLGNFNRVNNENKHGNLVEQTRKEAPRVTVKTAAGAKVSWDPGAVRFGSGVKIGGVPVDPRTQMPVPDPSQEVKRVIWVDFRFEELDISAIGLLRSAVTGISDIAAKTQQFLT